MTDPKRERPTDAQLAILSVLWTRGPATVREVHEALPEGSKRGYTTTLKQMQIMAEQGLVERDESQRSHVYNANVVQSETQGRLVDDLMQKAFGGSATRLVMRALSDKAASAEELAEVRELLDRLEGEREGGQR